jgi:DNA-directed RNA polymerase specialized sigma24 family protein
MKRNSPRKRRSVRQMAHPGGRPPAQPLADLELRHLRLLFDARDRARRRVHIYTELLEDFVLELRGNGHSARGIAGQLGVSSATVHTWTENARRRR